MLDARSKIVVDIVVERQPAVDARRFAPVHDIQIYTFGEQVADERAVLLQVGHRVTPDQTVDDEHRYVYRVGCDSFVVVERRLVDSEHFGLRRSADLHVAVLDRRQKLATAHEAAGQLGELLHGLHGVEHQAWHGISHLRLAAGGSCCGFQRSHFAAQLDDRLRKLVDLGSRRNVVEFAIRFCYLALGEAAFG